MSAVYSIENPDFTLSPCTGMTRKHWILAAKHLLSGIFSHIKTFESPVIMPRAETNVTYPHASASESVQKLEACAERFEGLARSFFIAAPLLTCEPDVTMNGYSVAGYYKSHILRACTPSDPLCVGTYSYLQAISGNADPFRPYQQTVETCALVIGLEISKEYIWNQYTREEKDVIAAFLSEYASAPTVPQNWRLFNMLVMAFLAKNGYPIDEAVMYDHAAAILNYYVGDGWYRDGQSFDYYSCWAFNVYAPLWCQWYGYEHAPDIASQYEEHVRTLMKSFPAMFDRDGFVTMWGRSCVYRCAVASAFEGALSVRGGEESVDLGLARKICSGALLQFITREDFYYKGIPTMGFYRQFSPLVQGYSCAESPFWLGKIFLCLALPQNHPFWTTREKFGFWRRAAVSGKLEVKTTVLSGPGLCITNHRANGTTLFRTAKVLKQPDDGHGIWNYGKLCYASKYPWEAVDESQQYVLTDGTTGKREVANATFWHGEKDGVLYRRQFFSFSLQKEMHWMQAINLADFAVPYGIFRVDRLRLFRSPVAITLGSFGFPDNGTEVIQKREGDAQAVILKGSDSLGNAKQLAMTVYGSWDSLETCSSEDTNPESPHSLYVLARTSRHRQYDSTESYLLVSQVITKESPEDFTDEELFPLADLQCEDHMKTGGYGCVTLTLKTGVVKKIDFSKMEGLLQL
ncbi:MAG: DUF2264 domain-containing protein [Treponema sp.]|nr:DUF2264 domain-containing protein [Treponema sp.]